LNLAAVAVLLLAACQGPGPEGGATRLVVNSNADSCSARAGARALCPDGFKVSSGGYRLDSWDQRARGGRVEPVVNEEDGNGWHVMGPGPVGTACFTAFAVCER
jgi:hypothetical protein